MAFFKGKLRLGEGYGLNLSEKGISPYFTTPIGPVDAGLTCFRTPIKGVSFSIGKNPANMFLSALKVADQKLKQQGKPQTEKKEWVSNKPARTELRSTPARKPRQPLTAIVSK